MDIEEYKIICNRPDTFRRDILETSEQTLLFRHSPSVLRLQEVLKSAPISKPLFHSGDKHTDYFLITLNVAEAEQIAEHLVDAEADAVGNNGETTSEASRYASLIDVWVRYINYCDDTAG